MNKNLIIRVFPSVREEGKIRGYEIKPLNYTPDNLSSENLEHFLGYLRNYIPQMENLGDVLTDPKINVVKVEFDESEECEPLIDITIEDPGFLHSHIKDIMIDGLNKLAITKNSFTTIESFESDDDQDIEAYIIFEREYVSVIECD